MSPVLRGLVLCVLSSSLAACGSASGAAGAGGSGGRGGRGGRGGGGGLVPVVVGHVTQKDVPVDIAAIGNVEAYSTITVRAQVTGVLTGVHFNEGDFVKPGDKLFTIDPRPYQAALQEAEATLARDEALLTQSQAQLARDLANAAYLKGQSTRQGELVARGLISKDLGEQATSAAAAGDASVAADQAAVKGAEAQLDAQRAAVDSARLQLGYTSITSPISGRTGSLMAKAGNLVTANSTELLTITQIQPVYVTFSIPAVHLPAIKQHMAEGVLDVTATPQDGGDPAVGQLSFIDNAVDPTTDTIKLKATFKNADHVLWPGQFARVSLRVATLPHVDVVAAEAVQTGQDGQFVFVVKPDSTVEQRPVTTGQAAGEDVVITKGLATGETVVTEGQLRLEPGTHVTLADPTTGEAAAPAAGNGANGRGGNGQGRGRGGRGGRNGGRG
ncbi:MAG TPA: efflux RND transporter periplasmic adaptor subunit [Vicinamibacterales bacterium]|nr:efflux RND transporter periplasmic adaptor subunit [Vicinamibacterales bacterium]